MAQAVGRSSFGTARRPSAAGCRWLAVVALVAGLLLVAAVVVVFLRRPLPLVIGVGGTMLAAAGGWWAATERMPRRAVGMVALGVYATVVQQEGYRGAKLETSRLALPDLMGRTAEPFDLQFTEPEGRSADSAFLIMVSNNPRPRRQP